VCLCLSVCLCVGRHYTLPTPRDSACRSRDSLSAFLKSCVYVCVCFESISFLESRVCVCVCVCVYAVVCVCVC